MRASMHFVGDVEREPRQDRPSAGIGRCAKPSSCRFGVAFGHRKEREQPTRVASHRGCALLEHDLRDLAETASLTGVAGMDREPPERDDAGGVEHRRRAGSVLEGEASFEHRERLGEPPGPQEHAAVPGLEHLIRPALLIALGGGETVGSDRERLLVAVGGAQQLAVPHVREPQALVVAGEDPVAIGARDQLERAAEPVVGVLERALGDAKRERRPSVIGGLDRCTSLLEDCTRFVNATGGDEVVEEAGEMAGAQGLAEGPAGSARGVQRRS